MDPAWIELEITENTVMSDPLRSAAIIRQLRQHGITIAVDDFGTGYSSLSNLRDLTLDWLKIDQSFVTDLAERPENLVIVRSVIDLARNLGLRTVAEGVEGRRELELLRTMGCDEAQGFFVGHPMSPADLCQWLDHRVPKPPLLWRQSASDHRRGNTSGILSVPLFGGKLSRIGRVKVRMPLLIIASVLVQILIVNVVDSSMDHGVASRSFTWVPTRWLAALSS